MSDLKVVEREDHRIMLNEIDLTELGEEEMVRVCAEQLTRPTRRR